MGDQVGAEGEGGRSVLESSEVRDLSVWMRMEGLKGDLVGGILPQRMLAARSRVMAAFDGKGRFGEERRGMTYRAMKGVDKIRK